MVNPSPKDKINRQLERKGLALAPKLPEKLLFYDSVLEEILSNFKVIEKIDFLHENNPFYILDINGKKIAVAKLEIGPKTVQLAEEARVLGARDFFIYGSCGALIENTKSDQFFLIEGALAGDYCSLYYQGYNKIGKLIKPPKNKQPELAEFLRKNNINFTQTIAWTTFGFYRQTEKLRQTAIKAGAAVVDGEMASMFAFANYHKLLCNALLYWSDKTAPGQPYQYRDIKKGKSEYKLINNLGVSLCRWLAK